MDHQVDPRLARLIADLSERMSVLETAQADPELVAAERASIGLAGRLASAIGQPMRLRTDAHDVMGQILDVSATWVEVAGESGRTDVVSISHLCAVTGLGRVTHTPRIVDLQRGWGYILRRCGAAGSRVIARLGTLEVSGRVVGVGKDQADIVGDDGVVGTIVAPQLHVLTVWSS
ncbi:MAG: hypothetical protein Q4P36_04520 [Bowdeniella nasicola]|nr:hypothetical protein [Bowdeniella nasicola]